MTVASADGTPPRALRAAAGGHIERLVSPGEPDLEYRLFVPKRIRPNRPVFVAVHGISRDADEQLSAWAPHAARHGLVLIAPHFDAERFPDYQRLGRSGRGPRADHALLRVAEEVRSALALHSRRLLLFGYSGGGQFVHRFTLAYPKTVRAAVVAAAGWYTFPEAAAPYPLGLNVERRLPGIRFRERALLRVPTLVVVGDDDTAREASLNRSRLIDRQQGRNRVERADNWCRAMRAAAERWGLPSRVERQSIPAVGHSFSQAFEAGLGTAALSFLRRRRRKGEVRRSTTHREKASE